MSSSIYGEQEVSHCQADWMLTSQAREEGHFYGSPNTAFYSYANADMVCVQSRHGNKNPYLLYLNSVFSIADRGISKQA